MNENLQIAEGTRSEPGLDTYTQVRDYYGAQPDADPYLLAHLDHWAQKETQDNRAGTHIEAVNRDTFNSSESAEIESPTVLDDWAHEIDDYVLNKQQGEPDHTTLKEFINTGLGDVLQEGGYTPQDLNKFLINISKYDTSIHEGVVFENMPLLLKKVPTEVLREAYETNTDEQASAAQELVAYCVNEQHIRPETLQCLQKIYNTATTLDLTDPDDKYLREDTLVQEAIVNPSFNVSMLIADIPYNPERMDVLDAQKEQEIRDWSENMLTKILGLTQNAYDNLAYASYSRTLDLDTGRIHPEAYVYMLTETVINLTGFYPEDITHIKDKTGIVNFDYYTYDQLDRMNRLFRGDKELITHLQEGDVTVVFLDAYGDHNGVFKSESELYEKPSGRTLFFEISEKGDFYRYSAQLKKLGIKPSTLVLGAHGDPGKLHYGVQGEEGYFALTNDDAANDDIALHNVSTISRYVEEYMQDSQAVDDAESALGRRRIILDSCSQAAEVSMEDEGRTRESTAVSLTRVASNSHLDVFAAEQPMTTQKTSDGYDLEMKYVDDDEQMHDMPVTHHTLDAAGNLRVSKVKTIQLLRRPDAIQGEQI